MPTLLATLEQVWGYLQSFFNLISLNFRHLKNRELIADLVGGKRVALGALPEEHTDSPSKIRLVQQVQTLTFHISSWLP